MGNFIDGFKKVNRARIVLIHSIELQSLLQPEASEALSGWRNRNQLKQRLDELFHGEQQITWGGLSYNQKLTKRTKERAEFAAQKFNKSILTHDFLSNELPFVLTREDTGTAIFAKELKAHISNQQDPIQCSYSASELRIYPDGILSFKYELEVLDTETIRLSKALSGLMRLSFRATSKVVQEGIEDQNNESNFLTLLGLASSTSIELGSVYATDSTASHVIVLIEEAHDDEGNPIVASKLDKYRELTALLKQTNVSSLYGQDF